MPFSIKSFWCIRRKPNTASPNQNRRSSSLCSSQPIEARQQEYSKMATEKILRPNLYIEKLVFNNGETLQVGKGDIVVFVGPNNVGKSQVLKDIYNLTGDDINSIVVKEVSCSQFSVNGIIPWYDKYISFTETRHGRVYSPYGNMTHDVREVEFKYMSVKKFGVLRDLVIHFLNTEARLLISRAAEGLDLKAPPKSPIHALVRDASLLRRIANYVKEAFGTSIAPLLGKEIPLCIGPDIDKSEVSGSTMSEVEANYLKKLESYPQLQDQGDGMRSFTGIILWLILEHYNIFLIDEPETFLHPPQATLLGSVVGELISKEQQAFIATHSMHFINGLLEKVPSRVKIVRVTRSGNSNDFSVLDNTRLVQISKDPFLRYSALLDGMFYKNVVLCEGDADCMFYSMLNNADDMNGAKGTDTLFTHCGGKQRMPKVIGALKELRVDVKVIPDFDVLNNEVVLKELVQVCGGDWGCIERDYKILIADINQRSNVGRTGADVLKEIEAKLADVMETVVSPTKMRNIRKSLESRTVWDQLKTTGVTGVGAGNPRSACESILEYLSTIGIHVVPCGELECFVPTVGGHGPDWLHTVIEQFPDAANATYDLAKAFVRSWCL